MMKASTKFGLIMLLSLIPLLISFLVLWVWTPIDCIKRPDDKFAIGGKSEVRYLTGGLI